MKHTVVYWFWKLINEATKWVGGLRGYWKDASVTDPHKANGRIDERRHTETNTSTPNQLPKFRPDNGHARVAEPADAVDLKPTEKS